MISNIRYSSFIVLNPYYFNNPYNKYKKVNIILFFIMMFLLFFFFFISLYSF